MQKRRTQKKRIDWSQLLRWIFSGESPLLITVAVFGVIFLLITGVSALFHKDPADDIDLSSVETGAIPVASRDLPTDPSKPSDPDLPTDPDVTPTTGSSSQVDPEPVSVMMEVDERYFEDALFIGDSRTDGLRLFSPIDGADYYCGTSMNIFKVMDSDITVGSYKGLKNLLKNKTYGKIYIMFGINECGYDDDVFAAKYRSVIEEIRASQPDAIIYIQSILYVTQKHEANYPVFASDNIKGKNAKLKELANDVDVFYLEVNDVLNDGTDHLPSDYTGDGVHLKANYYHYWKEYLLAHAVVDPWHPWKPLEEETPAEP